MARPGRAGSRQGRACLFGIIGSPVDNSVHHRLDQAILDLWRFIVHKGNDSTHLLQLPFTLIMVLTLKGNHNGFPHEIQSFQFI